MKPFSIYSLRNVRRPRHDKGLQCIVLYCIVFIHHIFLWNSSFIVIISSFISKYSAWIFQSNSIQYKSQFAFVLLWYSTLKTFFCVHVRDVAEWVKMHATDALQYGTLFEFNSWSERDLSCQVIRSSGVDKLSPIISQFGGNFCGECRFGMLNRRLRVSAPLNWEVRLEW